MNRWPGVVLACVTALAASRLLGAGSLAPVLMAAFVLLSLAGMVWFRTHRSLGRSSGGETLAAPVVAGCWLVLGLFSMHSFGRRSSTEATTTIWLGPIIELLIFLVATVVAAVVIRWLEPDLDRSFPPWMLFLLPVWVIVSALWSESSVYAIVRGLQMACVPMAAWATIALGRRAWSHAERVVELVLKWFVRVTLALVALGAAFGPIFATTGKQNADRFSWIGAHPNNAGLILSIAIVIVAATPPAILGVRPWVRWGAFGVLVVAMYANHSRTSWVGVIAGLLAVLLLTSRLRPRVGAVAVPLVAAGTLTAVYVSGASIWDYIVRDENSSNVSSGNGRKELWKFGIESLDTPLQWLGGHGYGASRTLFVEQFAWAGEAHGSLLALLVSGGLIAVGLLLLVIARTILDLGFGQLWRRSPIGLPVVGLLAAVLVNCLTTDVLAEPQLGFIALCFVASVAAAGRLAPEPSGAPDLAAVGAGAPGSVG